MIKLRKYHYYIWRLVSFVLPILFFLAVYFRPSDNTINLSGDIEFIIKDSVRDSLTIINIEVASQLRRASCIVYANEPDQRIILGRIENIGKYSFEASHRVISITLRDHILNRDILQHTLTHKR